VPCWSTAAQLREYDHPEHALAVLERAITVDRYPESLYRLPARRDPAALKPAWHFFHVFAALAEFIRELIVEGTREGLDAARGQRLGSSNVD
jgi:hypothetical protein